MSVLTITPIRVAIDGGDGKGLLVLHDNVLVAVFACLDQPSYGGDRGHWHLEAGFGHCATRAATYRTLEAALRWVAQRLGIDVETAIAPALAQYSSSS